MKLCYRTPSLAPLGPHIHSNGPDLDSLFPDVTINHLQPASWEI